MGRGLAIIAAPAGSSIRTRRQVSSRLRVRSCLLSGAQDEIGRSSSTRFRGAHGDTLLKRENPQFVLNLGPLIRACDGARGEM